MSVHVVCIPSEAVKSCGELGSGSLNRRFRDSCKTTSCSYCVCLKRDDRLVRHSGQGVLVCDRSLKRSFESKHLGLNCDNGQSHIYRYSNDSELVPYTSLPQVEVA